MLRGCGNFVTGDRARSNDAPRPQQSTRAAESLADICNDGANTAESVHAQRLAEISTPKVDCQRPWRKP